jgi:serine/threonine protein kinase
LREFFRYDSKADIFSLGCILYEAITVNNYYLFVDNILLLGKKPFDNATGIHNMKKNCDSKYERIKTDECDGDVAELCHSMLNLVCEFFFIVRVF